MQFGFGSGFGCSLTASSLTGPPSAGGCCVLTFDAFRSFELAAPLLYSLWYALSASGSTSMTSHEHAFPFTFLSSSFVRISAITLRPSPFLSICCHDM